MPLFSRVGEDIATSVKKSCSPAETAPKRKHVRACIVYTWDTKSSRAFWQSIKMLPLVENEVQVFKALITIHKVCQEGHPSCLEGGYRNIPWIQSLGRGGAAVGGATRYSRLIAEYSAYIVQKMRFHHEHSGFNGTFEYKEYLSLTAVSDPNEGFQNVLDLEDLQDSLDDLGRLVMAAAARNAGNECMTSALVPLVAESYGIYRFIVSMLRAMYASLSSPEALDPLRERFVEQHHRLYNFYADCSGVRYLTTLVSIPKLPYDAPDLTVSENAGESSSDLPRMEESNEPSSNASPSPAASLPSPSASAPTTSAPTASMSAASLSLQPTGAVRFAQQDAAYQREQQALAAQQAQLQQQQAAQAAQWQAAQLQQQQAAQASARDVLALRGQHDQDQLMLQRYDERVAELEKQMSAAAAAAQQEAASKDEHLKDVEQQADYWKNKYEALARLYSQLRREHLDLLGKFKRAQQTAASAKEAVAGRQQLQRDLDAKAGELADLIKQRDRARLEAARQLAAVKHAKQEGENQVTAAQEQVEQAQRDLESARADADKARAQVRNAQEECARAKEEATKAKSEAALAKGGLGDKQLELEAVQQAVDETVGQLAGQQKQQAARLAGQSKRLIAVVDAVLAATARRIQRSDQASRHNDSADIAAAAAYAGSLVETCSNAATDFALQFNGLVADGVESGDVQGVVDGAEKFGSAVCEVVGADDVDDKVTAAPRTKALALLHTMQSDARTGKSADQQIDAIIAANVDLQQALQALAHALEARAAKAGASLAAGSGSVDQQMASASETVAAAAQHAQDLLAQAANSGLSVSELAVHRAILSCAIAVIQAVQSLMKASVAAQREIVERGRAGGSPDTFYRRNSRWTQGLVSAARAVAYSTGGLIRVADKVVGSKDPNGSDESAELIVASREVMAATAQLVAAARVKSDLMSRSEQELETSSQAVRAACQALVERAHAQGGSAPEQQKSVDYSKLTVRENRTAEIEQQVQILKLQDALTAARSRLGEIRRYAYRAETDPNEMKAGGKE